MQSQVTFLEQAGRNSGVKGAFLGLLAMALAGCGGGSEASIKTPADYVAEQERLADEQAKAAAARQDNEEFADEETDSEAAKKWDEHQAELELTRATRSAQDCPDALPAEEQARLERGVARVNLVFSNSGHVKTASIEPPYAETPVGKCILRAMGAVIVPAYVGNEETVQRDVDLRKKEEK